ncbi:MAG: tetratricopeptide repeat protein [Spirochaetaceae bacterium]|nr:tetratricopeptide repeat protein [Spirochaetaceae bacterium]
MEGVQIIIIAVSALGVGFLAYFIIKSTVVPKRVDGINKLIKQGKTSAAVKLAKSIIAKNQRDYKAHYYLGKAYLADNKPELALMEFKIVNQNALFDSDMPEVEFRKQIAQLYLRFNQPDEALKEYLLLTKLEPRNPECFFNAAKLFEQKNKSDQALNFYQQTIRLDKKHTKAHAALGMLLYRAKQFNEAKKEINLAISLNPNEFSTYFYLGKILKEGKDYPGAVDAFEKAMRDPEFKQRALLERGSCFMAVDNPDKAFIEFDRAVKASKNDASQETLYSRYFLAACYEKMHKIDMAIAQWEKIYAKNHSFLDTSQKLTEYRDIQANDSMKEYLTCSSDAFVELCKKIALSGFNLAAQKTEVTRHGCRMIATEAKNDNWMNNRPQLFYILFYREPEPIDDSEIRIIADEVKKQNYGKAIICTSSGFSRQATVFAENRPLELVNKAKFEAILAKAGI